MQGAGVPRAVELVPGLADEGDGAPHPVQVPDRIKDRHEHLFREFVKRERGAAATEAAAASAADEAADECVT
jgi:hypothetical protein